MPDEHDPSGADHRRAGDSAPARAVAMIRADETLLASYLLHVGGHPESAFLTDEQEAQRFLLWFAVEGRKQHQQVVFSSAYLGFLSEPAPPYVSRLAAYALLRRRDVRERIGIAGPRVNAWFYLEGVDALGLAPLVGARERLALHAPARDDEPRGPSRLAMDLALHQPHLVEDHDLSTPKGRELFARWFRSDWLPHAAPWQRIVPLALDATSGAPEGVNLFGFADGVLGVGEDVRTMAQALLRAGLHVAIHNLAIPAHVGSSARHGWHSLFTDRPVFATNLFCLPPFEMKRLKITQGVHLFAGRRNIGVWPWELPTLPPEWRSVFDDVDEIWAISRFLGDTYRKLTDKPVRHCPPHVDCPAPQAFASPRALPLSAFTALTMLDFNSFAARKNPEGAIEAFRKAFPDPRGEERLIVKSLNGHANRSRLTELLASMREDPRITLLDEALTRAETFALLQHADCLLSLHRAEGYGRVLAEAMLLGVPVIATDWSGNTDFLDETTGWPIPHDLRPVGRGEYVYAAGSHWAEPRIEAAAVALRTIRAGNDPSIQRRTGAARQRILAVSGLDVSALRVKALLDGHGTEFRQRPERTARHLAVVDGGRPRP